MSIKTQVVFIPHWVKDVLNRNSLELGDCLVFEKVRPLLSLNDLAGFVALQDELSRLTGLKDAHVGSLSSVWMSTIPSTDRATLEDLVHNVLPISSDPTVKKELAERLFSPLSKTDRHKEPFITYDLTPRIIGVVINPGFFCNMDHLDLQAQVVDSMLKVLYVYESYNEVAKTPLFKRYLELLSTKEMTA